jgi:iron complex outermembrane receptor protein
MRREFFKAGRLDVMATLIHPSHEIFRCVLLRMAAALLFLAPLAATPLFAQSTSGRADEKPTTFDIAAAEAPAAMKQFISQSGEQLLFSTDEVQGIQTNAVRGSMAAREALDRLLVGTSLSATRDEKSGALAVGRKETPGKNVASRPLVLTTASERAGIEEPVVQLDIFRVSTQQDRGYRASNSVSGSRVDTPIKDLPFAIQAFTSEFIKDVRPSGFIDLVRFAPGVSAQNFGFTTGDTGIALRGFSIGTFSFPLRDGLIGPSTFSFNATERVEIIKGPASFLYGQLAPGGIVNVITKSPLQKFQNTISVTAGAYDFFEAQVDVGGKLGNTGFAYRLPVLYTKDIRYWDPYESSATDIAPSVSWTLNDRLSVVAAVERYKKLETPPLAEFPNDVTTERVFPGLPNNFNMSSFLDRRLNENTEATVTVNGKLSDNWSARARYGKNWSKIYYRWTGEPWMFGINPPIIARWGKEQFDSYETDSYEADVVGKYVWGDTSLRFLGGFSDSKNTRHAWGHDTAAWDTSSVPPAWDLTNPSTWDRTFNGSDTFGLVRGNAMTQTHDKGFYAGLTLGLFKERLLLLGGARRTESSIDSHLEQWDYTPGSPTFGYSVRDVTNFDSKATTPQMGVLYKVTPEVSVYASYSKSFVPSTTYLAKAWVPTGPAKPTFGEGYEAGIKTSLFDGRISSTLTVYDIKNTNIIRYVLYQNPNGGANLQDVVQSGQDESKGVEFDINYSPVDNWQLYASYAYCDAGVKNDESNPGRVGYRLVNSVRNTANLWTRYDFKTGPLANTFIGGGFNYIGGQVFSENPTTYRETYTLYSAMAGYKFKMSGHPVTMTINGKNLGNKFYRPGSQGNGRPREIQVTFTTTF